LGNDINIVSTVLHGKWLLKFIRGRYCLSDGLIKVFRKDGADIICDEINNGYTNELIPWIV
jgi:hypothetical protein